MGRGAQWWEILCLFPLWLWGRSLPQRLSPWHNSSGTDSGAAGGWSHSGVIGRDSSCTMLNKATIIPVQKEGEMGAWRDTRKMSVITAQLRQAALQQKRRHLLTGHQLLGWPFPLWRPPWAPQSVGVYGLSALTPCRCGTAHTSGVQP